MKENLLDKEITISTYGAYNGGDRSSVKFPAKMTVRDAIKAGHLSDPEVALQIFALVDSQ